ncbi:MAG: DUF72 domain-containing protein [Bryobacteraceae bacterium]|nr:DUF72 domain-containing protein [Bryobacteraceae bacterium]
MEPRAPAWQPSLFEAPRSFDREGLASRLRALAAQGIFIGTSSWKYVGWLGQIYTRERYLERGRFSEKLFQSTCLAEYAETFPIVCGDFSFYQFPSEAYWRRLFRSAPPGLLYAFKAPEQISIETFPRHDRYGAQAGTRNEFFLDAELFQEEFLNRLAPYRAQVAVIIIEFGAFSKRSYRDGSAFAADLEKFLSRLPVTFRYAVEIRNPDFLVPDYFECLRAHGVAHVFNAWTRMPELAVQIAIPEAYTADFTVTRALLRRGRTYEEAVQKFAPYDRIQEENPRGREAMRELIRRARARQQPAFIFVNNRFEGNAPRTIEAVVEEL